MVSTILTGKKIEHEQIDLTDPKNNDVKQVVIEDMKAKSIPFVPPIIYIGDEYVGVRLYFDVISRITTIFLTRLKWKTWNHFSVFLALKPLVPWFWWNIFF